MKRIATLLIGIAGLWVGAGAAWSQTWGWQEMPLPDEPRFGLQDVYLSGHRGVMLQDWSYLWLSDDGGETWRPLDLQAVADVPGDAWAVAARGRWTYVGGDGFIAVGSASRGWTVTSPERDVQWGIYDIATGPEASEAVAVGFVQIGGRDPTPLVMVTREHGEVWQPIAQAMEWEVPRAVVWTRTDEIIVVSRSKLYMLGPDGMWRVVRNPAGPDVDLVNVTEASDAVWVTCTGGKLLRRGRDGSWYVVVPSREAAARDVIFTGAAFLTRYTGVVIGHDAQLQGYVYHTQDGGATWRRDVIPYTVWRGGSVVASDNPAVRFLALVHLPGEAEHEMVSRVLWRPGPVVVSARPEPVPVPRYQPPVEHHYYYHHYYYWQVPPSYYGWYWYPDRTIAVIRIVCPRLRHRPIIRDGRCRRPPHRYKYRPCPRRPSPKPGPRPCPGRRQAGASVSERVELLTRHMPGNVRRVPLHLAERLDQFAAGRATAKRDKAERRAHNEQYGKSPAEPRGNRAAKPKHSNQPKTSRQSKTQPSVAARVELLTRGMPGNIRRIPLAAAEKLDELASGRAEKKAPQRTAMKGDERKRPGEGNRTGHPIRPPKPAPKAKSKGAAERGASVSQRIDLLTRGLPGNVRRLPAAAARALDGAQTRGGQQAAGRSRSKSPGGTSGQAKVDRSRSAPAPLAPWAAWQRTKSLSAPSAGAATRSTSPARSARSTSRSGAAARHVSGRTYAGPGRSRSTDWPLAIRGALERLGAGTRGKTSSRAVSRPSSHGSASYTRHSFGGWSSSTRSSQSSRYSRSSPKQTHVTRKSSHSSQRSSRSRRSAVERKSATRHERSRPARESSGSRRGSHKKR